MASCGSLSHDISFLKNVKKVQQGKIGLARKNYSFD
jgi:hypothetical protein